MFSSAMKDEAISGDSARPACISWPWRVVVIAILLTCALASSRQAIYYWTHGPAVSDLRIFRTGIEMVREGEGHHLYRFDEQEKTQLRLYPEVKRAGALPFNHLAYELLLYWPFLTLPDHKALIAWACLNIILVFAIAHLLKDHTEALCHATGIPSVVYLLAFYPLLYALGQGQDSVVFLFLVVLSCSFSEKHLWFLAGFVLALALFKFHLAITIAFLLFLLRRRWAAAGGFAAGAILVTGISRLIAGPSFPPDYIAMLRNQETVTPWGFVPWFMPNLRGLLQWFLARWLDIGSILPVVLLVSLVVGMLTILTLLRSRAQSSEAVVYSAAASATILISYHLHMQDLSLALLPMLLLLDNALRRQLRGYAVVMVLAVAAFYLYRVAAVIFPILLIRGCLLALPTLLLWIASMSAVAVRGTRQQNAEVPQAMY